LICRSSCRCEVKGVNAIEISINEWEGFVSSSFWGALKGEIEERDKYLMELLRHGDEQWTDEELRARVSELEYFKTLPEAILVDLRIASEEEKKDKEEME